MLRTTFNQSRAFSQTAARSAFAKMQLLGSVGNVNARETKDGVPFITYSLAVNRYSPNSEDNKATDWFNISVFNDRHISFFNNHLKPGMQLFVECDVRQRVLTDENGNNTYVTNLRQLDYDVVRFAKKQEESEESQ